MVGICASRLQERSSLDVYKNILIDVQERRCFYCREDLHRGMDVDHFIPWSRYPVDLGHNFVLAHPACNNSKSDHLAAETVEPVALSLLQQVEEDLHGQSSIRLDE